jgi:hypothetical protein
VVKEPGNYTLVFGDSFKHIQVSSVTEEISFLYVPDDAGFVEGTTILVSRGTGGAGPIGITGSISSTTQIFSSGNKNSLTSDYSVANLLLLNGSNEWLLWGDLN